MTGVAAVNTAADLHRIPIVQQGAQVGVIHLVQKIGGELFQIFIHRGIVVDDDVEHLRQRRSPAANLAGIWFPKWMQPVR